MSTLQVRDILCAAPCDPPYGKAVPWRFVVFSGAKKELFLKATLDWHLAQSPEFWENAYHKPTGEPAFKDCSAFATYFEKVVCMDACASRMHKPTLAKSLLMRRRQS